MLLPGLRGLAAVAAALCVATACSDPGDPEADPTSAAQSTGTASPSPPSPPVVPDGLPPAVAELCATYVEMAAAVAGIDPSADTGEVVDELAPVMRGWAEELAGAQRPAGVPADVWAGVELLAERILSLPEHPTYEDLEAVATDLSPRDTELFTTASTWFLRTCEE